MNFRYLKDQLLARAAELGFDACRVTSAEPPASAEHYDRWLAARYHGQMAWMERSREKRRDLARVLPEIRSVITLAVSYHQDEPAAEDKSPASNRGVVARYARFSDYHDVLAAKLKCLTEELIGLGAGRTLWYVDTGPILERDLAQRAGLGFIGKHTNLISRSLGNWFFLAELLTAAELPPDTEERNRCGKCRLCLDACPTQAIVKPFSLDANRCISYLTIELGGAIPVEWRSAIGNRIFGCDDCLEVCPWNRFAREGKIMKDQAAIPSKVALEEWAGMDAVEFARRFRNTPLYRTKWQGLIRNVCVALGNVGNRDSLPVLERLTRNANALVAEHARWAVGRIEDRFRSD